MMYPGVIREEQFDTTGYCRSGRRLPCDGFLCAYREKEGEQGNDREDLGDSGSARIHNYKDIQSKKRVGENAFHRFSGPS